MVGSAQRAESGAEKPPANGPAIAGFILGILSIGLWFFAVCPVLAVVFSAIGLAKSRSRGGRGKVLAWIGLILGVILTLVGVFVTRAVLSSTDEVVETIRQSETSLPAESDQHAEPTSSLLAYTIADEEVYDAPIKTSVTRHVVVSERPSEEALRELLLHHHREMKAKRGFQHNPSPTLVAAYVYDSREKATAGAGQWLGMIIEGPMEQGEPRIDIRTERLEREPEPDVEKFGLSESERRGVFREMVLAEDRAMHDAMAREPSDVMRQIDLERDLKEQYTRKLADCYGLTPEQLDDISREAFEEDWALPKLQPN